MKRRQFNRNILLAGVAGFGIKNTSFDLGTAKSTKMPRLKKGDTIGLITPGSYIEDEGLEKAVKNLEDMGFVVKPGRNIRKENGFNAGTDIQRLDDLHAMYTDRQVNGIWCARGGYGTTRLLPYLNYKVIKNHPKALIGYSDITALLNAIYVKTGHVGFHGPVGASEMTEYTKENVLALLTKNSKGYVIKRSENNINNEAKHYQSQQLYPGQAEGILVGGNLSLLTAMAGTEFAPNYDDKLLFMEDVGEKPYRIDRMLTQMRQSTDLKKTAALLLGIFEDCEADKDERSLSLMDTITDRLQEYKIPSIYGLSFGHIKDQMTLPIGVKAKIHTGKAEITLLESATED